jgi:hypothetical protein
MNKEIKQEASIPVQTRTSVVSLAELDQYWTSEGRGIKSMSQLVSWSVELLCEVLRSNGKIKSIESIAEAHRYLEGRELYQPSLRKRSFDKLGSAIRFENLREVGEDPGEVTEGRENINRAYKMLHNKTSVQPFNGVVQSPGISNMLDYFNNIKDDEVVPVISSGGQIREMPAFKLGKGDMPSETFNERERIRAERDRAEQEEMDKFLASQKKE